MPNLQIMVLDNQPHKPFQQRLTLQWGKVVDLLHVVTDREYGFPACDGVGADYGMDGDEVFADVVRGAAGVGVELEIAGFGGFVEAGLGVGGCEAFEELLIRLGKTVEELVAGCPERIYWYLCQREGKWNVCWSDDAHHHQCQAIASVEGWHNHLVQARK